MLYDIINIANNKIKGKILWTNPYGKYIIVMFNKEFHNPLYYANHDATVYGARVSRIN